MPEQPRSLNTDTDEGNSRATLTPKSGHHTRSHPQGATSAPAVRPSQDGRDEGEGHDYRSHFQYP